MKYKACFFDIDGTIYSHQLHTIPESTKETLTKLKEKGWKVGISTSRCKAETANLPSFYRNFDFDAFIYDGGARVVCGECVIQEKTIPKDIMEQLLEIQKESGMDLRYSTAKGDFSIHAISTWYLDVFFELYLNMPTVKPYEGEAVYNVLIQSDDETILDRVVKTVVMCNVVRYPRVLELTTKSVEKSDGILALSKHWGISMDEIICFGDGLNDIEMIKNVGLGVAMGNGKEALKEVADAVCGHIDENGLAEFFKKQKLL